ncbi:Alb1-domain-containing protein [Delphinella strobiligena]|nr:Alb1-domain-containing protein [Delphinella strobiligena]
MGKFAKAKKAGQISEKSRAARRAASPSLDVDKSITSLKADPVDYKSKTLGVQDGGISKKKNQKRMTRAQRIRHEKGLERADRNVEVLHTKREKSIVKGKRTKDRAGEWEELNKKYNGQIPTKVSNAFQAIADAEDDEDDMSDDNTPAELKALNKQSVFSAQNLLHFDNAPAAVAAPVVSEVDQDDIDEVL